MFSYRVLLAIVSLLVSSSSAYAAISVTSEVTYEQAVPRLNNLTGSMASDDGNINHRFSTPNSSYMFDVNTTTTNPFQLKSSTRMDISVDDRDNNMGWDNVSASAFGSAGLVDTAVVNGVPDAPGGSVEFQWTITGESTLKIDPLVASDAYFIQQLHNIAWLDQSSEADAPVNQFIHDRGNQPFGVTSVDSTESAVLAQTFSIPWTADQPIDILFQLKTSSSLQVQHLFAAGFTATAVTDFSNTATLQSIQVYDANGTILPDAMLTSTSANGPNYSSLTAVPEPSAACFLMLLLTMTGGVRFAQRWRAHV